jgi:hypothetical protein
VPWRDGHDEFIDFAAFTTFFRRGSASVMSGIHAGVHVLLKEYMPRGVYIHCSAHRLNLVISDTCKAVNYMLDYFGIVSHIHSFFTDSAVTSVYFNEAQKQLGLGNRSNLTCIWIVF